MGTHTMGNQTSSNNSRKGPMKKLRNVAPLSPLRRVKVAKTPAPRPRFDWLDCYNVTASNPHPQELPNEHEFSDFILHHDQKLGEGSFAKVILATHIQTRQKVAVKITTKANIPAEMRQYVRQEPGVLAQLHHNNIVRMLHIHEDSNYIYMFLQYMEGGDLHSRLERDGAIPEDVVREWFKQIVSALEYTHNADYCHRDLKLENLLISGEGKKAKVMMIDYGFAGHMPDDSHRFGDFPGSFCYAAPELIRGVRYCGRSADVYSMGVILYTLLQSSYPHYSEDRREMTRMILNEDITFYGYNTAPARELTRWMLAKDPASRPTLAQIKNHPWLNPDQATQKLKAAAMSPIKTTVQRLKETARASLSPVPSRRRRQSAF